MVEAGQIRNIEMDNNKKKRPQNPIKKSEKVNVNAIKTKIRKPELIEDNESPPAQKWRWSMIEANKIVERTKKGKPEIVEAMEPSGLTQMLDEDIGGSCRKTKPRIILTHPSEAFSSLPK